MKNVRINIYHAPKDNFPEKAHDFIEWFKEKISVIPEEFKETATIELEGISHSYDSDSDIWIDISYERPETKLEKSRRESCISVKAMEERKKDLKLLEELKEKYPNES